MLADMSGPPPPEEDMDLAGKCLTVKDIDALTRKWKRPPLPPTNEAEQELSFQQLECDYTIANRPVEFARGSTEARAAAVRMYGVTNEGHSILAHIHGFLPYFWVKAPPGFTPEHAEKFKVTLNARVKAGLNARDMCEAPIVDVRLLARKSIMGYQFDAQAPFLPSSPRCPRSSRRAAASSRTACPSPPAAPSSSRPTSRTGRTCSASWSTAR
jgi:DNA polymerase delta subunit 1